jgi:membrane-bound serine protease (ClpP class)
MIAFLAIAGLVFIFLEFFLPGFIMGVCGTLMLLASLWLFYFQTAQIFLLTAYAAGIGLALWITIRWALSRVKKGRILHTSDQEGFLACSYSKEAIGKIAIATSDLKPSGYIEIDGRIFAALSKLGYIDKGTTVRIIGGQGAHLIVSEEKIHHDHSNLASH